MQGFFVKVKDGETVSQANFTLMMTTDRWISGGTAVQEPAAVYINVVNDDNLCSTAKVVVCNDADDEFVDEAAHREGSEVCDAFVKIKLYFFS
jgi:hypothetical protein